MTNLHKLAPAAITVIAALAGATPAAAKGGDRNHDRLPDAWEKRHDLSLKVSQARRDQDRDGLRNLGEYRAGTNPRRADSDGDGVKDGDENAGTIRSFEDGILVVALAGGGELTAKVTAKTRIECPPALASAARLDDDDEDEDKPDSDDDDDKPDSDDDDKPDTGEDGAGHGNGDDDAPDTDEDRNGDDDAADTDEDAPGHGEGDDDEDKAERPDKSRDRGGRCGTDASWPAPRCRRPGASTARAAPSGASSSWAARRPSRRRRAAPG